MTTPREGPILATLRWILAAIMVTAGVLHFTNASTFLAIVPPFLPWALEIVWITGIMEIALGLGLLIPRTRALAGWGLAAFFVAVFPANIYHAFWRVEINGRVLPDAILFARLPLQFALIALAWAIARRAPKPAAALESEGDSSEVDSSKETSAP
jgi:uncharacterized membrane protein